MKVFLGNSPWTKKGYYGVRAGSRWPHFEHDHHEYMPFPFFLVYAAAVLEENDHEVLLVDGVAENISENEFINRLTAFTPELIVLEVSTISIDVDLAVAEKIKKIVGDDSKVALCGLHAFMYEKSFLEAHSFVDYILIGEYEYTLRDLTYYLQQDQDFDDISGLIFRDSRSNVIVNKRRPLIEDLDELPWPARHFLPMENYHDEPGNIPRPSVQMLSSRGCPFECVFCAWPQIIYGDNSYRTRDPVDVVDEFEWLVRNWGFRSVYFDDDTFNIGRDRIVKICEELKKRQLNTPWAAMCRADTMTTEMLEAMVGSGLHAVKYGIESADQELVKSCGKALNIDKVKDIVRLTHEFGIKTHLTFMFGLQGETIQTAQKTIDLALELNPESVQFSIATPFPGSTYYVFLKSRGLITCNDFSKYDGFRTAVVRTETLSSSELEEIVQRANDVWLQHVSKRKPFIQVCNEDSLVSVIIPNFNGKTFLKSCLDSLVGQTKTNNEIILVDNDSEDDSVDFVKRNYPEVHVIALPANKGFSVAVNEGIKHANGTFIAVLNNDTIVAPDWLELLCNCLVKHPDAGFCTSKIVKMDNPDIIDCAGHGITRSGYTFNTRNGVKDSGEYNVQRDVFGASAAAAVYRKSMLDDIGLFDEDFFMYLEDIDLSFRAQLWGYKCMYLPEPAVKHVGFGTTGKQYYKDNIYYIARNTVYLLLKNMPRKLLKKNFLRIMMFFFCLQLYHTLRTYHPLVCSKGILSGLKDCRKMISKRKRILGCMRVTDSYILDKLIDCESKYKRFRKRAFWQ